MPDSRPMQRCPSEALAWIYVEIDPGIRVAVVYSWQLATQIIDIKFRVNPETFCG
jgi:hypothetical protein